MRTMVLYAEALEADKFVDIDWAGHFSIPFALPGVGPRLEKLAIEFAPDNRVARLKEFTHNSGNKERAEKALWEDIRKWMKASASAKP